MPAKYLLHVHSQPTKISAELWQQWYIEEHIRDMVYFGATKTGAVYHSSSPTLTSGDFPKDGNDEKQFFALYQTDRKHVVDYPEYKDKVRSKSALWDKDLDMWDLVAITIMDMQLVEVLGSYEHNESVAPHVIEIKLVGPDAEGKIQFDHINAASKLDGYRRTLLYRPLDTTRYGAAEVGPYIVLIHEFDSLDTNGLGSVKDAMEAIGSCRDLAFQVRAFELLYDEGFDGKCRTPERL